MRLHYAFVAAFCAALIASLAPWPEAHAANRLQARIYLTQKGIPRTLSERGLLQFAKQHRARRLAEMTDAPIEKRHWFASLVASFNAPVGDSEFEVLFYDTQGPEPKFLAPAMTVFVSDRNQRTFVHKLRLKRPQFEPNRRIEMVLTVRRQEVGRASFQIYGEEVRRSGEVTFSDDEAR